MVVASRSKLYYSLDLIRCFLYLILLSLLLLLFLLRPIDFLGADAHLHRVHFERRPRATAAPSDLLRVFFHVFQDDVVRLVKRFRREESLHIPFEIVALGDLADLPHLRKEAVHALGDGSVGGVDLASERQVTHHAKLSWC